MKALLSVAVGLVVACSAQADPPVQSGVPTPTAAPPSTDAAAAPAPVPAADAAPPIADAAADAAPVPVAAALRKRILSTRAVGLIPVKDAALARKWRRASLEKLLLTLAESTFARITVTKTACKDSGECARVYLDPCATFPTSECEGFYMTIVVRLDGRRVVLDHMISPTDEPAHTIDDIVMYADTAP